MRTNERTRKARGPLGAALCLALAAVLLGASWSGGRAAFAAQAESGWRIRVRNCAAVPGPVVHLGEIAEAVGDVPQDVWTELSARALWNAPTTPGRPVAISRDNLRVALRHYLGDLVESCVLPSRLVLQTGGVAFEERDLQRKVVDFLTSAASKLGGDAKFREWMLPDYVFLPDISDHLDLALGGELAPGRIPLQFRVRSPDGRISRKLSGSVFLDLWKALPCAATPLNRLEPLTLDKVTFKKKNVAYYQDAWDGKGAGWRVLRPVGTGQVIMKDSIEPAPAVIKGETVDLIFRGKNITLSVKAEALEDGALGEEVQVRNMQTRKVIVAVVEGGGTVRVK